jgi:hypothetical protein
MNKRFAYFQCHCSYACVIVLGQHGFECTRTVLMMTVDKGPAGGGQGGGGRTELGQPENAFEHVFRADAYE